MVFSVHSGLFLLFTPHLEPFLSTLLQKRIHSHKKVLNRPSNWHLDHTSQKTLCLPNPDFFLESFAKRKLFAFFRFSLLLLHPGFVLFQAYTTYLVRERYGKYRLLVDKLFGKYARLAPKELQNNAALPYPFPQTYNKESFPY